jgi:integrase
MKIETAADLKRISPPSKGNERHPVDGCPGLNLKVTEKDARSWTFRYRPRLGPKAGASREFTIGDFPVFGFALAKDRWKDLRRRVKDGEDPLNQIEEARAAPTMRDLSKRYLAEVSSRKKSGDRDREKFEYINARLGSTKVAGVTFEDCDRLHQSMADKPVQANRTLSILKSAFNFAIKLGWRDDNPAQFVKRYTEQPRERYLTDAEYPRLFTALAECSHQIVADMIRFILLTGCRKSEAFQMKWSDVDLAAGVWIKPTTKIGRSHRVALSAPAMEIITRQPRNGEHVFATKNGRAFVDIKDTWTAIRKAAQIEDLHLHDLRHSAAALLASDGLSLRIIGELLGHRQASTTQRYAHVDLRASRAAAEHLGRRLSEAEPKSEPKAEVADLKRGA